MQRGGRARGARINCAPASRSSAADLMKPEIVQRNDTVTLVYEAPGLMLTLRGQAQEAGALGDTISVLNAQTKRVVQGVVSRSRPRQGQPGDDAAPSENVPASRAAAVRAEPPDAART